jgi:hypothetical protein
MDVKGESKVHKYDIHEDGNGKFATIEADSARAALDEIYNATELRAADYNLSAGESVEIKWIAHNVDDRGDSDSITFTLEAVMARYTLIEFMPAQHWASHLAAGNAGVYPHNGAERVYVEGEVDSRDLHPRWATVIEDGLRELPEGETALADIPADALAPVVER